MTSSVRSPDSLISLVIPVFNEQEGLPRVYEILNEIMSQHKYRYEIVVSDNGSTDQTEQIMQDIAAKDPRWKYVRLSRNFGYQNNISVGMSMARGDAIITIDSDLQDPPEMIATFLEHWEQGYDVVYGVRIKRTDEPPMRIAMTMTAMRLISWMADYPLPPHSSDFRLITKQVRDAFVQMPETSRYVRGMIHWVGFRQIGIPYTRRGRQFDQEKRRWGAGVLSLFNFMLDAIFSFSLKPLRVFSVIGALILVISLLLSLVYVVLWFIDQSLPPGFTTLTLLLLFNIGIGALGIGILGEYIGRIYTETKNRPLWIVNYTLNFEHNDRSAESESVEKHHTKGES